MKFRKTKAFRDWVTANPNEMVYPVKHGIIIETKLGETAADLKKRLALPNRFSVAIDFHRCLAGVYVRILPWEKAKHLTGAIKRLERLHA